MSEEKAKVDVNVVQVVASALAAVSSAVLLSTVGVAGTIIGAAAGSVIATVGSAVYSYSLRVSRERVAAAAQVAAMARMRRSEGGTRHLGVREAATADPDEAVEEASRPRWREALAALDKKKVALAAAGVFLAAMVVIVGFELVVGRPVSELTGGTSRSDTTGTSLGIGHSRGSSTPTQKPSQTPTTAAPSTAPTTSGPTSSSTPTPTATPTSGAVSPSPSATPTTEPSGTTTPPPASTAPSEAPAVTGTPTPLG